MYISLRSHNVRRPPSTWRGNVVPPHLRNNQKLLILVLDRELLHAQEQFLLLHLEVLAPVSLLRLMDRSSEQHATNCLLISGL